MASKPVNIVVIGASHAGLGVAHRLVRQNPRLRITLVNPSSEYYFNIAAPRFLVNPDSLPTSKYLYSIPESFCDYSTSFTFLKGLVTAIDPTRKSVAVATSIDNAHKPNVFLSYDYLVIASGSTTPAAVGQVGLKLPFKSHGFEDTRAVISNAQEKLKTAKTIVIGGGGPLGIEMAGELSESGGPRKRVILVSSTNPLLPGATATVRKKAQSLLLNKHVEILKPVTVVKVRQDKTTERWTVSLSNGQEIDADAYISTTGVIPNNQFIPKGFLNEKGWVNVDEYFRVKEDGKSMHDIYAVGDITSYPDRLLSRIPAQVGTVTSNIIKSALKEGGLVAYSSEAQRRMMVVPIGRSTGTGHLGKWTLLGCLVWYFKGKDFLVYKAPKFLKGEAD